MERRSDSQAMARIGRIGGLVTAATHDGLAQTARAREVYRDSFLDGHFCKVCPSVVIPPDLPEFERHRRAQALRRAHFARMALRRKSA